METTPLFVVLAAALAGLGGCKSMRPLPIVQSINAADGALGGLDPPVDTATAIRTLKAYGSSYLEAAGKLRGADYAASDASYGGAVLGVAGGLTKSPQTAILGALLNGGGSVARDRYQYQVQAANYENAAAAMFCLRRVVAVSNASIDFLHLNEQIDRVRFKLHTYQSKVVLGTPDLGAFKDAVEKQIKAKGSREGEGIRGALLAVETNAELDKCASSF